MGKPKRADYESFFENWSWGLDGHEDKASKAFETICRESAMLVLKDIAGNEQRHFRFLPTDDGWVLAFDLSDTGKLSIHRQLGEELALNIHCAEYSGEQLRSLRDLLFWSIERIDAELSKQRVAEEARRMDAAAG